jgi:putative ubiquitin-RnfH superfamily antitoxin RatB of RatAB toxin-antitoxin module
LRWSSASVRSDSWLLVCSSSACWFSSVACDSLQRARLFFELFVGGAQFFLLHLQFLVELLGLGQHVLQLLAVARGGERGADVVGHHVQQLARALVGRAGQAELDHAVDDAVVHHRHQQHGSGRHGAQAGVDLEVVGIDRVDQHAAALGRGLAHQALGGREDLRRGLGIGRETVARRPAQRTVALPHIHRADAAAQVPREEGQDLAAHVRRAQLADQFAHQLGLRAAQPGLFGEPLRMRRLLLEHDVVAVRQPHQLAAAEVGDQRGQRQREEQEQARPPTNWCGWRRCCAGSAGSARCP